MIIVSLKKMEETEVNIAATMGIKGEHVTKGVKDKGKGIGRSKVEIVKKSGMKINLQRNEIERNTRFKRRCRLQVNAFWEKKPTSRHPWAPNSMSSHIPHQTQPCKMFPFCRKIPCLVDRGVVSKYALL